MLDGMDDSIGWVIDGYGFDDYFVDVGLDSIVVIVEVALVELKMNYEVIDCVVRVDGNFFDVLIMLVNCNEINFVYKIILLLNVQVFIIVDLVIELGVFVNVVDDDVFGCDMIQFDLICD